MWPCKQTSDWKFKHDDAPRGEKCIKKNETYRWTLKAPGGVSVPRPPLAVWTFWSKNSKIQLSTQKNFNISPALARACGLESKLQTQNSSSHSDARHCILILTNQNFNSSFAQAWPCGLASKLQTRILSSHSNARRCILILKKKTFNIGHGQAWPCGLASKLQIESSSMMLPPGEG
jgi:hypothetical protein